MAKATGLISSLFDIALARQVTFYIPQFVRAMHASWTYVFPPLCPIDLC